MNLNYSHRFTHDGSPTHVVIELLGRQLNVLTLHQNKPLQIVMYSSRDGVDTGNLGNIFSMLNVEPQQAEAFIFLQNKDFTFADANAVKQITENGNMLQSASLVTYNVNAAYPAIFGYEAAVVEPLLGTFKQPVLQHSLLVQASSNFSDRQVQIIFYQQLFSLVIRSDDGLKLAELYAYENEADVLYYLLQAFAALGIDPATTDVYVAGNMSNDSALYNSLNTYVNAVHDLFPPTTANGSEQNESLHHYLLKLKQCVL